MNVSLVRMFLCAGLTFAMVPWASAASPERPAAKIPADAVELFAGIESGEIEVKLIPKDSKESTLMVVNKTDKPLTIKMPEVFAALPVAAQFGGCPGIGCPGGGGIGGGGGMQGMMGGMGGMGMGMGMGGMGMGGMGMGGMFNVPAERVKKLKVTTVCLDHGKKDPNPRVAYEIAPVESYAKDANVIELGKMLVRGEIDQHSAQAAAWHLQNGLSWQELTAKIGAKHLDGRVEPYFRPAHLQRAMAAARIAVVRAEKNSENKGEPSIGEELAKQQ